MLQNNRFRTVWCTYTFVSLGVLVAINLILTRFFAINVGGFGRIQLGAVARIMAGVWFGPAAALLCGLVSDLLGCLIQGYAVNPIITLAAMLWGFFPAILLPNQKAPKKIKIIMLCVGTALSCVICTLVLTTAGLVLFNGYNLYAILPTRLTQFALQTPIYCVLVCLLYFSPVTTVVNQSLYAHLARKQQTAGSQ